jgi:hypothetical protein
LEKSPIPRQRRLRFLHITVAKGKVVANIGIIKQEFMDITQELDIEAFWEKNAPCQAFTPTSPVARSPSPPMTMGQTI